MKDYRDLVKFAKAEGFTVTATTGGKHNVGSKQFQNVLAKAIETKPKIHLGEKDDQYFVDGS